MNQKTLRSEQYYHLKDSINNDHTENIGNLVIQPSTHTGSPMCKRAHDGLCYARKFGTADLFITFTCNGKWKGIKEALRPRPQTYIHAADSFILENSLQFFQR